MNSKGDKKQNATGSDTIKETVQSDTGIPGICA
jgi:hypothetical protein